MQMESKLNQVELIKGLMEVISSEQRLKKISKIIVTIPEKKSLYPGTVFWLFGGRTFKNKSPNASSIEI